MMCCLDLFFTIYKLTVTLPLFYPCTIISSSISIAPTHGKEKFKKVHQCLHQKHVVCRMPLTNA